MPLTSRGNYTQASSFHTDYDWLERDHSYIQWLFPIRERGLNPDAQVLQLAEANLIATSADLKERFRKSYEMMLDFYGMRLVNAETGDVARRGDDDDSFLPNYANLNKCGHNYLRITRILKSLGEMGFEHYKKPFVMHVAREMYTHGHLTNCEASCLNYWGQTLRDDEDRASVTQSVKELVAARAEMDPPLQPELYEGHIGFGRFGMYY